MDTQPATESEEVGDGPRSVAGSDEPAPDREPALDSAGSLVQTYLLPPEQVEGRPVIALGNWRSRRKKEGSMKIVMRDGRVFQGTALQIVKAMQDIAFGVEDFTVPKYIEWVVTNARQFEEVELDVKGETDAELAASLVAEMLRTGLTAKG